MKREGVQPVISVTKATKRFGRFVAVGDASFNIRPGEVVGFVGANGAGKTTTISMLLGFLAPSEGEVRLFGETVRPWNAQHSHRCIGYAAGDMELPAQLTGRQYLNFLRHQGGGVSKETFDSLVNRFSPQLDKKIRDLSRGNKQKIALVAAFLRDPDLVILDEPTSGLDPVMQEAFLSLVRDYRARGKTVFMSSHYLQEVAEVCSRVILMRDGRIIQDVAAAELLARSGKQVSVKTGHKAIKPPKAAESVETSEKDGLTLLSFVYKADLGELQRWLAAVKQLRDVEVTEYNLEEAFRSLYESEEKVK